MKSSWVAYPPTASRREADDVQGQLVFSGAVKSQTAGCSPERLISKSSNSHLRDERFISERRLERPTGGPALQGWRTPVRVPATGCHPWRCGRLCGAGSRVWLRRRDGTPCAGLWAWRWAGGSVLLREPRRGILGGTLGGRCPATTAPRPVAVIRCREAGPAHPYAVPRRTRRRGAAGPTAWGRRRAGGAGACCAR